MKYIYLFFFKYKTIKKTKLKNAIFDLYYINCRIPTIEELKKINSKNTPIKIKKKISIFNDYIPLFDIFTFNIYLIQKRNIYIRVINNNYRFPDKLIIENIKKEKKKKEREINKFIFLKKNLILIENIKKLNHIIEFMNNYDISILYKTYLDIFYKYSIELSNFTYTCIRKSFIPHKGHIKPYYTKDEIIKLGLNMNIINPLKEKYIDFRDKLSDYEYNNLCLKIQENDISSDILIDHQNFIIKNELVGLIQYYTLQGSYIMNQYLRGYTNYEYKNEYLEHQIKKIWNLILNSPKFDNDYILYRFINKDLHLQHLKINDIYIEEGFTSTTRDSYYSNELIKFGCILIKIKIPKNTKGIALCLETLSHFPEEEEIILPPKTYLKLIEKNNNCNYYHYNEELLLKIKNIYIFNWVKNDNVSFNRIIYDKETNIIDFLNLHKINTFSLQEKIKLLIVKYFNIMNQIKCKIGEKIFTIVGEWYDSSDIYENKYGIKSTNGFCLYTIYNNYILFMIEIGEQKDTQLIKVNYHTKYSQLNRELIIGDNHFIKFISSIAYYFEIFDVMIYSDYYSCDFIYKIQSKKKIINTKKKIYNIVNNIKKNEKLIYEYQKKNNYKKNQKIFLNDPKIQKIDYNLNNNYKKNQRTFLNDPKIQKINYNLNNKYINNYLNDQKIKDINKYFNYNYHGGSFCLDFYNYLKYNIKRYDKTDILNIELRPLFLYQDLDILKTESPNKIIKKTDRDEIYQIYFKIYKFFILDKKNNFYDNISDFYIWMIENKCYLMDIFIYKINRLYKENNPFKKSIYILDSMSYLYNRHYIHIYNKYIKVKINEEFQLLTLPKNDYRIRR